MTHPLISPNVILTFPRSERPEELRKRLEGLVFLDHEVGSFALVNGQPTFALTVANPGSLVTRLFEEGFDVFTAQFA